MVFSSVYLIHSFYYSSVGLIDDYIKKVSLLNGLFFRLLIHKSHFHRLFSSGKTKCSNKE